MLIVYPAARSILKELMAGAVKAQNYATAACGGETGAIFGTTVSRRECHGAQAAGVSNDHCHPENERPPNLTL